MGLALRFCSVIILASTCQQALAVDWNELQAKDWIKFFDFIEDTGVNDNVTIFPVYEARSAAKACTKLGEGSPACDSLCGHFEDIMINYLDLGSTGQLPPGFNEGDAFVGPMKLAKQACDIALDFN